MESRVVTVRFVRCPKCLKLLPEFSNVPMYQCGGCKAILEAKRFPSNNEKTILESPETNFSQTTFNNESRCHGSELLENINISSSNYEDKQNMHEAHSANSVTTESFYQEKDDSSDVTSVITSVITSVFSLSIKDENWSYRNNSISSFENSSQTSTDKSCLGSPNTKNRNDSSIQNMAPDEENEFFTPSNSFSSSNQYSKSNREIIFGVHSKNSSISTDRKSEKSLGSESFYSVRSSIEYENEAILFDSPSTSLNNRTELLKTAKGCPIWNSVMSLDCLTRDVVEIESHRRKLTNVQKKTVEKLKNQLESVCKTTEQNKRMYKFLIENANSGSSKRYVLPISKGAPFVICYKCFEMLHIPVYFLKKTRRMINKLKCGSCLEVLRLQLPLRSNEKLCTSTENANFEEDVNSVSVEYEVSVCESSGAEIEPELQASKDAPKVKYTLHQLMGYLSARMLLQ